MDKPEIKIGGHIQEKIVVLLKKDWSVSDFDNWVCYFFPIFWCRNSTNRVILLSKLSDENFAELAAKH